MWCVFLMSPRRCFAGPESLSTQSCKVDTGHNMAQPGGVEQTVAVLWHSRSGVWSDTYTLKGSDAYRHGTHLHTHTHTSVALSSPSSLNPSHCSLFAVNMSIFDSSGLHTHTHTQAQIHSRPLTLSTDWQAMTARGKFMLNAVWNELTLANSKSIIVAERNQIKSLLFN